MIVHPDFLDHWKTKALIDATGDKTAPLFVIRLWGFCQIQRQSVFPPDLNLKAICRAEKLSSEDLKTALITCGFLDCNEIEQTISVHQFEHSNKALRNSQLNGIKGGRPAKPVGSHQVSRGLPVGLHKSTEAKLRPGFMENTKPVTPAVPPLSEEKKTQTHHELAGQLKALTAKLRSPTANEPNQN